MRVRASLLLLGLAGPLLAACGGDGSGPPAREPHVRIELQSPADTRSIDADSIQVRGIVSPAGATVEVAGHSADVSDGSFAATVALAEGMNLIDVSAAATGARAGFAVVRVQRLVRVTIPRVVGTDAGDAEDQLRGLGLAIDEHRAGGFFDRIIPGAIVVCGISPSEGKRVAPHTTVELTVARRC